MNRLTLSSDFFFYTDILLHGNPKLIGDKKLFSTLVLVMKVKNLCGVSAFAFDHQKQLLPLVSDQTGLINTTLKGMLVGGACMAAYLLSGERKKEWGWIAVTDQCGYLIDVVTAVSGAAQIYCGYSLSGALTLGAFTLQVLHRKNKIKNSHYWGAHTALLALMTTQAFMDKDTLYSVCGIGFTPAAAYFAWKSHQNDNDSLSNID